MSRRVPSRSFTAGRGLFLHPGNRRVDALSNIVERPGVGILFLIPGVDETLRVNGTATIDDDPALREAHRVADSLPATVLVVSVREALIDHEIVKVKVNQNYIKSDTLQVMRILKNYDLIKDTQLDFLPERPAVRRNRGGAAE